VPAESAQRIVIANRADGGLLFWLGKLYGFAGIVLIWALGITAVSFYGYFANRAPEPPDFATYSREASGVTRIYAGDGMLLGEFASEWREVVPYEEIPKILIDAVLAAEDHEFFDHRGLYFRGIIRAVWANLTSGDFSQGGSTITQQVAKQFLSNEKSINRKALEAIMARRLEARYSKQAILSVYLNQIFLGNGAYGVSAAADRYFSKKLGELDLAEAATIAGLAQAPSRFDPIRHPEAATERRDGILDKMARFGFIDDAEAETWKATPLTTNPPPEIFPRRLPYYTEHVRRYITEKYESNGLLQRGLTIETAVDPVVDAAAYENVDFGARKQDKRQGWRGPEAYLEGSARDTFIERAAALYGDGPLEPGRRYLALVDEVDGRRALVRIGTRSYTLPLRNMAWAAKWSARVAINDQVITSPRRQRGVGVGRAAQPGPLPRLAHERWLQPALARRAHRRGAAAAAQESGRDRGARAGAAPANRDLHRGPPQRLRARAGRRLRLQPLRVQPRGAGVPPAGLDLQAHLLLGCARRRLRVRHPARGQADRGGGSGHG
jgi:penicillin-binding protein 1A